MGHIRNLAKGVLHSGRPDPRLYQIASLGSLLAYGLTWLQFDVPLHHIGLTLASAWSAQYMATRWARLPAFDATSALISALSLCLLFRTSHPAAVVLSALLAVGSKFLFRWKGKHLFNPTGLALASLSTAGLGWLSPGQWGQTAWLGFFVACLGSLVVTRAARADVTLAFLLFYVGALVTRTLYLGDPFAIPRHQLDSGSLLIFAFFMISDPKTTPDSRTGRIFLALAVALLGVGVQFGLYRANGPLWGLVACAPLVPLLDHLFPGPRFAWSDPTGRAAVASHLVPAPCSPTQRSCP